MITRMEPNGRFSRIVTYNGIVYLSGITADDLDCGVEEQTAQVLAKAEALLLKAGACKSTVLSATIWLRHIGDFQRMNVSWEKWVDPQALPARATVESKLALDKILVEIQITAALKM